MKWRKEDPMTVLSFSVLQCCWASYFSFWKWQARMRNRRGLLVTATNRDLPEVSVSTKERTFVMVDVTGTDRLRIDRKRKEGAKLVALNQDSCLYAS